MEISTAQSELRNSYVHGGPGAIVSGIVWLVAGCAAIYSGVPTGFAVLFFGGMLIFPISNTIVRTVFKRSPPSKSNPGGRMVFETVFPMIGCLFAAWLLMPYRPEFVFPVSAIAVGTHYFGFRSAYGDIVYWVLASAICVPAFLALFVNANLSAQVPFAVAAIEIVFGLFFIWQASKTK